MDKRRRQNKTNDLPQPFQEKEHTEERRKTIKNPLQAL